MKVSRYDEVKTMEFYCPFHGWSYSIDGSLVSTPGELYGVPRYETSYAARLDKSQCGLVNAPQVANYKGMIFATWDEKAPSFAEYLGDFHHWIDNLTDGLDGTSGTSEVFDGVQKWRVKANWKFVAENFLGDTYHAGPSHASVEQVGIGPGGRGRMRTGQRRDIQFRGSSTSFIHLGHGACDSLNRDNPYSYDAFDDQLLHDYFKQQWEAKSN
jgi:phenylpropionate dioxygenase-like ring-hydroxylating dioxygenase large terminal subunit